MTLDEIEELLDEALALRSPVRDPDASARKHIEELEDYMLLSAQVNGGLVEARHWLRLGEERLAEEWRTLQGWEPALRRPRLKATVAEVEDAKIRMAPQAHDAMRRAKLLRESVLDQIVRLEREERVCSRAYTMATGG